MAGASGQGLSWVVHLTEPSPRLGNPLSVEASSLSGKKLDLDFRPSFRNALRPLCLHDHLVSSTADIVFISTS